MPSTPTRKGDHNPKCSRSEKRQPGTINSVNRGVCGQANCPYKKYECNYCKKGHLAQKCQKKIRDSHEETH